MATATRAALLEREHELGTLSEGLDRARSGDGAVLLVEGPAGAGKTELVREARAAAAAGGMLTLEAKGSELERPFAFGVVRQLLESEVGPRAGAGELFAGAAAPAARLFEIDERGRATVDTDFEALHSLYWLVVNLADRAPLLLSVDDCHWADRDSVRFLSYLGQRIDGLQVAMLLAGRPPDASVAEAAALWGQLVSRADAVVLYPRPLSESAAVGLVRERLGGEAADEFCRACHAATGGNPLFLRELLGALHAAAVVPSAAAASDVQAVGPAAVLHGGSADAAAAAVQAALIAGLPTSAPGNAGFLAIHTLRLAEHYDVPLRLLDRILEGARREGHAARQGLIHGQRAWIALAQGSLLDAQIEAETGLQLIGEPHFALPQLLAAAVIVHVEDGDLETAETLAQIGGRFGSDEGRLYVDHFLTARGRLRIAQGRLREGVTDLLWCGERLSMLDVHWPCDWRAYAAPALAALGGHEHEQALALAHDQLAVARSVGAPGALGLSRRAAARVVGDDEALPLLQEAMLVLEPSPAKLELAHTLSDLAALLNRAGRRREGRTAARRAIELADQCGAAPLAAAARAEHQAGPGRPARTELTGRGALTAAEWRVCRQAAEGQTNREIAQALFVTEKTVERHLSSAYHKLGIRSRHQLASAIEQ